MDETLLRFLLVVGCGGLGAAVGAAFGALTGAVYWGGGRAAGTVVGNRVAEAFAAGGGPLTPAVRGALVGGVDGFLFLGVLGTAAGVLFAYTGPPDVAV